MYQLINDKGNPAANHFVFIGEDGYESLRSYSSKVATRKDGKVTLGRHWDYSATTLRHLKHWIGTTDSIKVMRERIESGEYLYDEGMV